MASPARATISKMAKIVNDDTWLNNIPADDKQDSLNRMSDWADGYFSIRYPLPLVSYGEDVIGCECWLAIRELVVGKGYAHPERNKEFLDLAAWWEQWLKDVAAKLINPNIVGSPPTSAGVFPRIVSRESRGWAPKKRC